MSLIDLLSRRKEMQSQAGDLRSRFLSFHFVRLPCFWQPEALVLLSQEVNRLSRFRKRRDLIMKATGDTPRRMSTLGPSDIRQHSSLLPLLYEDQTLLSFLSCIAGEAFYLAPDKTEDLVCNYLHLENDTHGAHIDTFPFAFNTTLEAPDEGQGGLLQVWSNGSDRTTPDEYQLGAGDCYLLRSDKVLHSVTPIGNGQQRTVLNFAYADELTLNARSYSGSILYG